MNVNILFRCWKKEPSERPSMEEVVNIMTHLFVFFKGAEKPIKYPPEIETQDKAKSDEDGEYS